MWYDVKHTAKMNLPDYCRYTSIIAINNKLHVIGGVGKNMKFMSNHWVIDINDLLKGTGIKLKITKQTVVNIVNYWIRGCNIIVWSNDLSNVMFQYT